MDEDWDILTILDACRYDTFVDLSTLPGSLNKIESVDCSTADVLRENWNKETWHDTVYVTAMPVLYNGQHDQFIGREPIHTEFHAQIDVWKDNGWNDNFRTVMPDVILKSALNAAEKYPNKRFVIHFSQPHCPFIGETGRKYYSPEKRAFWRDVMDGKVETEKLRTAYRENLKAVLPAVEKLMDEIDGKHVVTSDHGQALGERAYPIPMREWGHPPGIFMDELINIPWLEYKNNGRRDIVAEKPLTEDKAVENKVVKDRLADLGYIQS